MVLLLAKSGRRALFSAATSALREGRSRTAITENPPTRAGLNTWVATLLARKVLQKTLGCKAYILSLAEMLTQRVSGGIFGRLAQSICPIINGRPLFKTRSSDA